MHKLLHFRVPIRGAPFLVLVAFIVSLSIAFIAPVFPLYIKSLVTKEAHVGYVISVIAILLLISSFVVSKLLNSYKKQTLLKIGLLGSAITVGLLAFINNLSLFLILEIIRTFFLVSVYITMALLIREYAKINNLGKAEGMYFTVTNTAWLIGPLIGAMLAEKYTIPIIFLLGSIFPLAALLLVTIHPFKEEFIISNKNNIFENIKNFFKDKNLRIIYLASIGLIMWWSIIYTFTPLFIKDSNLNTSVIGYVFFFVSIPLILLEMPIGKLSDKQGFRKYFFIGFLIIALAAGLSYLFNTTISLIFIVLASIGAAFLEPLRESYILKKLKKEELASKYSIYRTSLEMGNIIGPIIFSTVLLYTNFKILYLFVGILMLLFGVITLGLDEINKK